MAGGLETFSVTPRGTWLKTNASAASPAVDTWRRQAPRTPRAERDCVMPCMGQALARDPAERSRSTV